MIFGLSIGSIAGFILGGHFYHPVLDTVMGWVKHLAEVFHKGAKGPSGK